jgi:hypothetical protein
VFYDNTDDPKLNLNSFLPQCSHGNIIITTRNPGLCVYAGAQSAVSDIEKDDAMALLLKSAAQNISPANERMAAQIVKVGRISILADSFDLSFPRNCVIFLLQLFRLEHSSHNLEPSTVIWTST